LGQHREPRLSAPLKEKMARPKRSEPAPQIRDLLLYPMSSKSRRLRAPATKKAITQFIVNHNFSTKNPGAHIDASFVHPSVYQVFFLMVA
jgi:hypothetical protein